MAGVTCDFSGADLTAFCRCAAKLAHRHSSEAKPLEKVQVANRVVEEDLSREITRANFEEAVKNYRRRQTISYDDIRMYKKFSQTLYRSAEFSRYTCWSNQHRPFDFKKNEFVIFHPSIQFIFSFKLPQ